MHFTNLINVSKLAGDDMLFFDDDYKQSTVEELGVCFHLTGTKSPQKGGDGTPLTVGIIDDGVKRWREQKASQISRRKSDR